FRLSAVVPTLSVPAPALVTSTSAPFSSTYRLPITLPSEKAGSIVASADFSASSGTIGTPPARRSSRLSALRTTITWVSQTWLCSRVPFLIMFGSFGIRPPVHGAAPCRSRWSAAHHGTPRDRAYVIPANALAHARAVRPGQGQRRRQAPRRRR